MTQAKANPEAAGLPNLHYEVMDAAKLSPEWTGKFAFISAFDAIHDQVL